MKDLFDKIQANRGPLGQHAKESHGYFTFPKLEGEISNRMLFRGKERLQWSLNNYLGLSNHPEIRKADEDATREWGLGYPMGARMMSGNTNYHEKLEAELAAFVHKQDSILVNFGYQGMVSCIDALVDRNDVIVYDAESHACIIDGVRLHQGKRYVFQHNNMENLEKQLQRATKLAEEQNGAILVITEGVFGMSGNQGKLKEIVELKKKYNFRILCDDAHGIGTMGPTGAGTGEAQGVQDEIDVYFGTFAKSFASIGGFIASNEDIVEYLRYNMRSQIFAKSLPMPLVIGALKRLEMIKTMPELREKLWTIANALQGGLKKAGFNIGTTNTQVTPVILSGGLGEATNLTFDLRENHNLFCSIVVYPVIPKGMIILRLIPTAMHTLEDVEYTIETFKKVKEKLEAGEYKSDTIAAV
ncbi:aminotransferase class I/II-fold pyridoxal phosphate-dependent enzyme [Acidiluteibacter ferrifornacis]|jgi:glycine C-acetyltransferase|uniref:Aminotransferase class I/II-fold pyridoxal phosphate-dependent enzyme n=1 Tax=Acidiluteibacter ferrifornacis TaxID=2692424 RepID=A0A6N9NMR0_9FLAO|nr:aminotransferase class I/II-fold pyridoxal phosphate-dependent enzyme [Acidiluteibacter ferrifornacis]MBR9832661.1 aminotransferase class I/II-fold pyridoxal phosphate-dependent enzyme [bacterium]NBG67172.1 aminotransferase class I/II-fold pyridoxal phosphate-dependent enzyme [Acidiluteibacter ferrifornacis]